MTFVAPGNFSYGWLINTIGGYFPQGTVNPYMPKSEKNEDDAGLVVIRDTMDYFDRLFYDAGVKKPELTEQHKAIIAVAKEELGQELAKTI